MGIMSFETDFADINITFFTEVWCFCLFIFAWTIPFISTCNTTFTNWVITSCKWFCRHPNRWYEVNSVPYDRSVLMRICFVAKAGWNNSWTRIVCAYEKNGTGKYKKTKLSNFCEKCNTYVCKNCFERYHTCSQPKKEIDYMIYFQWK